jgi:hypothetical protein
MEPKTPVEQFAGRLSDRERLEVVERRLDEVVTMLHRLSEGVQDLTAQSKSSSPLKRRMTANRNLHLPSSGSRHNSVHGEPPSPLKQRSLTRHMSLMETKSREQINVMPGKTTNLEAQAKAAGMHELISCCEFLCILFLSVRVCGCIRNVPIPTLSTHTLTCTSLIGFCVFSCSLLAAVG